MSAWGAALGFWKKQKRGPNGKWIKMGGTALSNAQGHANNAIKLVTHPATVSAAVGGAALAVVALGNRRSRTRITSRSAMHSKQLSLKVPGLGTLSGTGTLSFKRNLTAPEKKFKKSVRDVSTKLAKHGTAGQIAGSVIDKNLGYGTTKGKGYTVNRSKKGQVSLEFSSKPSAKGSGTTGTKGASKPSKNSKAGGGSKVATSYGPRTQRRTNKARSKSKSRKSSKK